MSDELRLIPNWKPGDTRIVSDAELDELYRDGCFDSYSQFYLLDGWYWKPTTRVSKIDGSAEITLICVESQP